MKTDIEIAREVKLKPIDEIASEIGISSSDIEQYGKFIAKVPGSLINKEKVKKSKLILVTSITPNKAGIGKTTVSIGLALGMKKIGKNAILALREPSLGPCFGMKGGAAGGGYAQVLPMEKINLHFTGDFHAITSANNMISALLDNYIYQHRAEGFGMREILWKRVLDVNDRSLRQIVTGLGPYTNGVEEQSGFDITPASEIMAILCLSKDIDDLKERIGNILLGYTLNNNPFYVKDMQIEGAIAALLQDALNPNLVQTTENGAAFIHGGPFANIAHGCNSILATQMAMTFGEYVITEAGFGADLGAEKFYNIKCRKAGLNPALTILVATISGLKMHGNNNLEKGLSNLDKHIKNIQNFGQTVLVCLNRYASDTTKEIDTVQQHCKDLEVDFAENDAYAKGGDGAIEFASRVIETINNKPSKALQFTYSDTDSLSEKIVAICTKIYGASSVSYSKSAQKKLSEAEKLGYNKFPICIAKTQYSFSQDDKQYGVPTGFIIDIKDIIINSGAEMIVAIAGDIIRMPGLPKVPQALKIDIVDGNIVGLS
jgi:hypothetical protein